MAETVQGLRVQVTISGTIIGDNGAKQVVHWSYDKTFSDGAGADQVQKAYRSSNQQINATSTDFDLGTGGLKDFQGDDLNYGGLKIFAAKEKSGAGTLTLKPGATNPMTTMQGGTSPTLVAGAGGMILVINPSAAGWALTDGTADRVALQTSGNSFVDVFAAGIS